MWAIQPSECVMGLGMLGGTNHRSLKPTWAWVEVGPEPEPDTYTISVSVVGCGSVTVDPLKAEYEAEEIVTVTAYPADGWHFTSWNGNITDNPLNLIMDADWMLTAYFAEDGPPPGPDPDVEAAKAAIHNAEDLLELARAQLDIALAALEGNQ